MSKREPINEIKDFDHGVFLLKDLGEALVRSEAQQKAIDSLLDFTEEQKTPLTSDITWERLCVLEPELLRLERDVRLVAETYKGDQIVSDHWYNGKFTNGTGGFKEQYNGLVGWSARVPALRTYEAHDFGYQYLIKILDTE